MLCWSLVLAQAGLLIAVVFITALFWLQLMFCFVTISESRCCQTFIFFFYYSPIKAAHL